jgi:hypothetical protein
MSLDLEERCHGRCLLSEVGLDHRGFVRDCSAAPSAIFSPWSSTRDPLGDAHHDLHVVLDQEDRQAEVVAELAHEVGELVGLLRVHAGGRLVEQQQRRVRRQRAGDLDAALVAVGEVARELVELSGSRPT